MENEPLSSGVVDTSVKESPSFEPVLPKKEEVKDVQAQEPTQSAIPEVTPQNLVNQLTQITTETPEEKHDYGDMDLKNLGYDEYGLYIKIPPEAMARVDVAQKEFVPVFMNVYNKYSQYEEWKYLNPEKPFVFSPTTIQIMSGELIPKAMEELSQVFANTKEENDTTERSTKWEESDIEGILNKLLAYESYRLERIMAPNARDHINKTFPNDPVIKVKELCTGAGITTALMYEALAETGKDIQFHTVDNSLQSVVCAATLLTLRGIPTRIVLDNGAKEKGFNGVTIYFETAEESMKKNGEYHFAFSDNGINYEPDQKVHFDVVESMVKKLKPGGLFQDCTLDPGIQVNLSTLSMFGAILSRKKEAKLGDSEYQLVQKDGVTEIRQLFSPSSTMQYELLGEVQKELGMKLFWAYLMGAKKAGQITQKLAPKIKRDLRETGAKAEEIAGASGSYYPRYEDQKYSLTRFYELKLPQVNGTQ